MNKNQNVQSPHNDPFLRDLVLFCTIARLGSFAAGAHDLGLSPSHASQRIALLEENLGVRLFHRTTRRVNITDNGEQVFHWAQRILTDVEEMFSSVADQAAEPRGRLRISTSLRLGRKHVAPILSQLHEHYPHLEVWLELQDRRADLIGENLDIDIRVGEVHEPHLVAHKIAKSYRILCAAPSYLLQHGEPHRPDDLSRHQCLPFRDRDQAFGVWRLQGPQGTKTVKVTGAMAANHSDVVRRWALEGHGIIMASVWDVADSLANGKLVQVLPAHTQPADIWAVTAAQASRSEKLRVCVDFLRDQLRAGPHALVNEVPSHSSNEKGPP